MAVGRSALVNGLNVYYQIHGTGQSLILLHGGLGSIGMFGQIIPALAELRQVSGVELQGHGHTADIDRPFSYEALADDIRPLSCAPGYNAVQLFRLAAARADRDRFSRRAVRDSKKDCQHG